jgi:hypothetical protein
VNRPVVQFSLFIILVLFIGLKLPGIAKDDSNYINSFTFINSFSEYFIEFSSFSFHEPFFHFSVVFLKNFFAGQFHFYFLYFAILAIAIKIFVFFKYGEFFFLSLAVYFSTFLPLHEMTQIRIAIGGGIVLLAWFLYSQNQKLKCFILICIACLFHYSSLLGMIVFVFNSNKPKAYYYYLIISLFIVGFFFKVDSKSLIVSLNITGISDKVAAYKAAEDSGLVIYEKSNIFNTIYFSKLIIFILLAFIGQELKQNNWYHLFLKIFGLSLALHVFLSADPTISFRISELLSLTSVFLISSLPNLVKERFLVLTVIMIYCFSVLSVMLFNDKLFTTYKFFFEV